MFKMGKIVGWGELLCLREQWRKDRQNGGMDKRLL